jgi:tetratricopeptide (TPR) repeat protein
MANLRYYSVIVLAFQTYNAYKTKKLYTGKIMSVIRFEEMKMPAGGFERKCNPLPRIEQLKSVPWPVNVGTDMPQEDAKYINYGCGTPLLPYLLQDNYNRERKIRSFKTAVLENEFLKAVFLTELGGRLWSLVYKPLNRELLYVNPVFQPANLAYRNAWFSGGVEWNMGMPAHSPFTCDKPFFALLRDKDTPVLRMYEWERIRNAPFQVDFYLPPNSPLLYVRTRLINPHEREIPAYWFSNIAVPESPGHRVLAPASKAYTFDYSESRFGVKTVKIPDGEGIDVTCPINIYTANDFFYRIEDDQRPWITSLDAEGCGLIQASTKQLKGRKLFVWGMNAGGRKWQEFLSEPGHPYIEIQAGLGRTQVECIPLPAKSEYEWLEVYGYLQADSSSVHGSDWQKACNEVETQLNRLSTIGQLETELKRSRKTALAKPDDIIQQGSGWGAIQRRLAGLSEAQDFVCKGIVFPESSMDSQQDDWLNLLENGVFPDKHPESQPKSYMIDSQWLKLLEKTIPDSAGWETYYHCGLMHYTAGEIETALERLHKSIETAENLWAYRALALIHLKKNQPVKAVELMDKAWRLSGGMPELADEYCQMLCSLEQFETCDNILKQMNRELLSRPRVQIARIQTCFNKKDYDTAETLLNEIVLVDIRECETTLTDTWYLVKAAQEAEKRGCQIDENIIEYVRQSLTPPANIDFRMHE